MGEEQQKALCFCVLSSILAIFEPIFEPLVGIFSTNFSHKSFFDSLVGQKAIVQSLMSNHNDLLSKKAYIEAGRALALYVICFYLAKGDKGKSSDNNVKSSRESTTNDIMFLLKYSPKFAGLSMEDERTNHWNDVAYVWRASPQIFLGGYAAERIKWKITEIPSFSDPEFEKSFYAQHWFWVDLDRNPDDEHVRRETIEGLTLAIQQLESQWKAVDSLATTLLEKFQLSAEETFQIIAANMDFEKLEIERSAGFSRSPGTDAIAINKQVAPKFRVKVNYEIIRESDLKYSHFAQCCDGNGDSFPFKCPVCGHIMVFCYECDTLYPDLKNTAIIQLHIGPHFSCPQCDHEFDNDFMINPACYVTPKEWKQAGYESLLTESAKKNFKVID